MKWCHCSRSKVIQFVEDAPEGFTQMLTDNKTQLVLYKLVHIG